MFEGHNLTLGFLETPYLSKVPQQVTHESGWGSKVNIERKSQIKQKKDQLCEISWVKTQFLSISGFLVAYIIHFKFRFLLWNQVC